MKHIVFSGGLGNQMFQYAFLLSMRKRGFACTIDISKYLLSKMHNGFEIVQDFGLNETIITPCCIHKRYIQVLNKYLPKHLAYKDRVYRYCDDVYGCEQRYLFGDWISERYFSDIIPEVVDTFTFNGINERNIECVKELSRCNSVSIHIRRGDYLKLPYYFVCDELYYERAIRYIQERVENPVYYVFSNDPTWCDEFMNKFNVTFKIVNWNQGSASYQDMYLMTQCKHNIIANSTFSWWGAWLNQNENKIVIAPKHWFKNSELQANCDGWHLIETR